MSKTIDLSLDGYPTMQEFGASNAYVNIVIGPAGSAKTSGIAKLIMMRAMLQEPDANGIRPTKWLVVRQTYPQLVSMTLPSFRTFFEDVTDSRTNPTPMMFAKFPLPDGTQVDCTIEFMSMDNPQSIRKILGYEPTGAFLDEVSELSVDVIDAVVSRAGRYPSPNRVKPTWTGVYGATNGPLKSHWLYQWYLRTIGKHDPKNEKEVEAIKAWERYEQESGRPFFRLHRQPPALIKDVNGEWQPNPLAENVQNLQEGYSYYYKMLSQSQQRINAYVLGDFSDLQKGEVVFPEYNASIHYVDKDKFPVPRRVPLMMAFDFGRTPVCIVAVMTSTGQVCVFKEFVGSNMAIETLVKNEIKPWLMTEMFGAQIVCAFGDPAGDIKGQAQELSPFDVLRGADIPIEVTWHTGNQLEPRLRAVRDRMTTLDKHGKPNLLITSDCYYLHNALQTNYVYEEVQGRRGEVKDIPTKTHKEWASDIADALQYLCLGLATKYSHTHREDDRIKPFAKRRLTVIESR